MTRALSLVCVGFGAGALILPCGGKVNVNVAPPSMGEAQALAEKVKELDAKRKKCGELKQKKVAYDEEYAIGGAVALAWVGKGGGLFVDLPKNATAESLRDGLKVQVPSGDRRELHKYVNQVGKNLGALSSRPALKWSFGVLSDDRAMNAFSAPGGYVLVTRAVLQNVENEAQLAGVLAHEIGHITERHALKLYSGVKANQCDAAVLAEAGKAVAGTVVHIDIQSVNSMLGSPAGLLDLDGLARQAADKAGKMMAGFTDKIIEDITSNGFAHDDEYAADRVAMELLVAAGYNPEEYVKFLGKLPEAQGLWAHHPKNADRQKACRRWRDGVKPSSAEAGFSPYADWPFEKYPAVAFRDELKAVRKK
ncbi:MAG: M48 family metalloprotease [Myxococcales bacterium]|nr:M48 family metalloprotease [Myxococcales bacterium]